MEIEEYIKEAEEMDKHPLTQEEFAKQIEDNESVRPGAYRFQ